MRVLADLGIASCRPSAKLDAVAHWYSQAAEEAGLAITDLEGAEGELAQGALGQFTNNAGGKSIWS